jgi:hypothetical protein
MLEEALEHHLIAHRQKEEWKRYVGPAEGNKAAETAAKLVGDHSNKY